MNPHRLKAYLLLFFTAVIWGVAGPIIKYTLGGIAPLPFLTYRFAVSSIAAIIFLLMGISKIPKGGRIFFETLLYGFLTSTVALGLLFFGLNNTTVLDMTFITAVGPLLIVLAGILYLKEHITKWEKTGMSLAFIGAVITVLEPLFSGNFKIANLMGNVLVFLYLLVNTLSVVMAKRLLRKGVSPITMTNFSFIIGFVTVAPLAALQIGFFNMIDVIGNLTVPYHLSILFMALISGNLAYALWVRGQKTIEIGEAALFGYLYPIFAAPLAVLWLKEKVTIPFVAGAIIISIGVFIAEYKKRRYNSSV